MNPALHHFNTRNILIILIVGSLIQLFNLFFFRLGELDARRALIPGLFGIAFYSLLFVQFSRNNYWNRFFINPWLVPYCIFIIISGLYGYWRFRSFGVSMLDMMLFLSIPAIILLRPFSFNVKYVDIIVAISIPLAYLGMAILILIVSK